MPKIIIQTDRAGDGSADVTLSERIVAPNLESIHYTAQLIERVAWATADAEEIERGAGASPDDRATSHTPPVGRRWSLVTRPGRPPRLPAATRPPGDSLLSPGGRGELMGS